MFAIQGRSFHHHALAAYGRLQMVDHSQPAQRALGIAFLRQAPVHACEALQEIHLPLVTQPHHLVVQGCGCDVYCFPFSVVVLFVSVSFCFPSRFCKARPCVASCQGLPVILTLRASSLSGWFRRRISTRYLRVPYVAAASCRRGMPRGVEDSQARRHRPAAPCPRRAPRDRIS